jgi:hypothetical protein
MMVLLLLLLLIIIIIIVLKEALLTDTNYCPGIYLEAKKSFDDDLEHHCTGSLESAI